MALKQSEFPILLVEAFLLAKAGRFGKDGLPLLETLFPHDVSSGWLLLVTVLPAIAL